MSGNRYEAKLLLAHLSLSYQYIPTDILRGEPRAQDFLKKNLNGRMLAFEFSDDRYLPESTAILYFLAQELQFANKVVAALK